MLRQFFSWPNVIEMLKIFLICIFLTSNLFCDKFILAEVFIMNGALASRVHI